MPGKSPLRAFARGLSNTIRRPFRALANAWRAIDAMRVPAAALRPAPLVYLYCAAVLVVLAMWLGHRGVFYEHFARFAPKNEFHGLAGDLWWAASTVLYYGLVPIVVIKLLRGKLRDHGLTFRGYVRHARIYLLLYAAVLPLVIAASTQPSFEQTYPLAPDAGKSWAHFAIFEAAYAAQFVALEIFFRGFLLFGLVRWLGALAIPVMVIPYALIHMGKPLPEALGAIVAGTVLGTLALHTRSVWGGVSIHYGVALTMDVLALWRKGQLFGG